jgi:hypothetical protein
MADAEILMDEELTLSERYRLELKVYKIVPSLKHPEGVKVRFVLIDKIEGKPRVVVDNHSPFGFHAHTHLPADKNHRVPIATTDYRDALSEFHRLVSEVLRSED